MPRPVKPIERKRRTGNPGKRTLPGTVAVVVKLSSTPEPLRFLHTAGRDSWDRIWESGSHWISGTTDIQIVQMLCECEDERSHLRGLVWGGNDWRDRVALRSLDTFILSLYSLLGFTPADRSKLGLAEVRSQSVVDELKARRNSG